jgi:hypothetical protein
MKSLFMVLSLTLVGCSTIELRKQQSSGSVGCAPSEITITDEIASGAPTWVAVCNGKTFFCSASSALFNESPQISCKEKQK